MGGPVLIKVIQVSLRTVHSRKISSVRKFQGFRFLHTRKLKGLICLFVVLVRPANSSLSSF